jgi:DNA-binding XRE family transcriptional regulator
MNVPHCHHNGQPEKCQIGAFTFLKMCQYVPMAGQGHHLKAWRKYRGLTQEQLAERIGIARSYLTKIERGDRRYDQPFLEAAADALRCSVADIIMRDPTDSEALWSLWGGLTPPERIRAVAVLKAMKGDSTGSND